MTIRILLADDHAVVREGLAAVFNLLDGYEVVGQAADGEEAVKQCQLMSPDVILMDVRMPGMDGIEATRRISRQCPGTRILMLTMFDDDATVFGAMRAGAKGYILKDAGHEEVAAAIRSVMVGQAVFGPGVATRLLGLFSKPGSAPGNKPFPQLTDREREILSLLAAGKRNSEIATTMFISPKTVSNQLTAVFAKLGVADRTAAALAAREGGLGPATERP